jgi:integrase
MSRDPTELSNMVVTTAIFEETESMASLYKKTIVKTDRKTGQTRTANSRKWWGRYRDSLGRDCRVPLATDKTAAQALLNERVLKAEREAAGHTDPYIRHADRPLTEHVNDFEQHLRDKDNSEKHVTGVAGKVRRIVDDCNWTFIRDLSPSDTEHFLANLRTSGRSAQTSNHYLRAIKQFSRWLRRDCRAEDDVLAHLSMMSVKSDRRHDRRALLLDEFALLIAAAETGPRIESIPGVDRAAMYVLAAWTGFRRKEIGSLTLRSLDLDGDPPTAKVEPAYSKRKQPDTQVLHPDVVQVMKTWLHTKLGLKPDELLFPVSGSVPGGTERKTAKMMKLDLASARKSWIEDSETSEEQSERESSDFLTYCDHSGRYADFHSNRHTFITSLERSGVSPRTAQSLARHSDIRLTMAVYTHIELPDQQAAIESLPGPTTGPENGAKNGAKKSENGAKNGAIDLASKPHDLASNCTEGAREEVTRTIQPVAIKSRQVSQLRINLHSSAAARTKLDASQKKVHLG